VNLEIAVLLIGALFFVVIFAVLVSFLRRNVNVSGRIQQNTPARPQKTLREYISAFESLFKPLGNVIPRSPQEMSRQEKRLVQAGFRRKDAAVLFHGAQFGLVLLFIAIVLLVLPGSTLTFLWVLLSVLGGAALPDLWLMQTIKARKVRIQFAMPDALDLACVCVEAGLGLDQALLRIADEFQKPYPDLCDEFRLRSIEVNMGRSRADAFRNLALRTGVDDLKALMAILIQTDRFGTSIGQALKVFGDSLRVKRQMRARESAAKLPVKMIPVMVLFIFPGIFVVVIGPAIIQMVNGLLPMLAGGQ